ncbi:MAG: DNA-binding protein [Alphaproteobacteria bacterium]|nr:DNA-binding protein [Alphaproteobacteria bacterium]
MELDKTQIHKNFKSAINMTAKEITAWLETDESKSVGQTKPGMAESIGRQSAREIIKILGKKKSDLTDADYAHMRHVVSYIKRHRAQEPRNIETSRWRYSLMNWGHDPVKALFEKGT